MKKRGIVEKSCDVERIVTTPVRVSIDLDVNRVLCSHLDVGGTNDSIQGAMERIISPENMNLIISSSQEIIIAALDNFLIASRFETYKFMNHAKA